MELRTTGQELWCLESGFQALVQRQLTGIEHASLTCKMACALGDEVVVGERNVMPERDIKYLVLTVAVECSPSDTRR